jgi:hypothetical protein
MLYIYCMYIVYMLYIRGGVYSGMDMVYMGI